LAREVARRVVRRVESESAFASAVLAEELARAALSDADRALATEIAYGVLRHRDRLDRALAAMATRGELKASAKLRAVLRVAAYQILFLRVPAHAAVDDAAGAAKRIGGARMAGFANGLLRRLAREGEPPLPEHPRARVAVEHSLPMWIVQRIEDAVGQGELADAAAALNAPAPLSLRADAPRDAVAERLRGERPGVEVELVAGAERALRVTGLGDPAASPSFREGLWTVQDLAAQRVAELVAPRDGQRILDACAGVGGKSTHLAALAPGATIDAADVSDAKLAKLRAAAVRLGAKSIRAITADLTDPSAPLAEHYDAVLIDAPCTGLGVLRRHPEAKWRVTEADIAPLAATQRRLLDTLAPRAAAIVYSVCTFTDEEGRGQIAAFLAAHPEFRLDTEIATWPHRDGADAFYAARIVRA
jgi:16S rRNA (cytosine967-C5)-methyltransferase